MTAKNEGKRERRRHVTTTWTVFDLCGKRQVMTAEPTASPPESGHIVTHRSKRRVHRKRHIMTRRKAGIMSMKSHEEEEKLMPCRHVTTEAFTS
jgi:hypothetical protein